MKCWSRSTLGVIVGALNILLYVVAIVMIVMNIVQINFLLRSAENQQIDREHVKSALTISMTILSLLLVFCLAMSIISILLIMGIIKRRHLLMAPWLVISAIGFVCTIVGYLFRIIADLVLGIPLPYVIMYFIIGGIIIGLQYLILYKIYALYKDIRAKYHENSLQMATGGQMGLHNNHVMQGNPNNGFHVISEKY